MRLLVAFFGAHLTVVVTCPFSCIVGAVCERVFGGGATALGIILAFTFFLWSGFIFFWCIAMREEPKQRDEDDFN
jgi:hypothetical protein